MDPRLRARRVAIRRQEGRRRLRRLALLLAVTVLAAAGIAATRSPLLDVDRVRVEGTSHTPAAAIRAASRVRPGDALVDVDPGAVRHRVAALPWVDRVAVRRQWPGTVRIEVTERRAAAVLAAGTRSFLVDATGRVLEPVAEPPASLVRIEGVDLAPSLTAGSSVPDPAAPALAVLRALRPPLRDQIGAVTLTPDGVDLQLREGGVVRLGAPADVEGPLLSAATVLSDVDRHCLAVLDVRVPDSPVLTRGDHCG
jgi:cell division protein FtsQ